jgi:hypothetical protein
VYPHIGDLTILAGYPPLKSKIIFCDYLLDHNLSLRMDHQFKEDSKMVPKLKISSISPKEIEFKGEQKKFDEKEKNEKNKERKRRRKKIYMRKRKKYEYV